MVNDYPVMPYIVKTDMKGKSWTYQETAEVLNTKCEQVPASNVKKQYLGSVHIHCIITSPELMIE